MPKIIVSLWHIPTLRHPLANGRSQDDYDRSRLTRRLQVLEEPLLKCQDKIASPRSPEQRQRFLPLCPDFVIELCSPSDTLTMLQHKMREYMANGASAGWLIEPEAQCVYVFRPHQATRR